MLSMPNIPKNQKPLLTEDEIKSAVAVQMGQVVHVFRAPYRQQDVMVFRVGKQPAGIRVLPPGLKHGSPYKTVQLYIGKRAPEKLEVDVGIQDMTIIKPARPGTPGTIRFKSDQHQSTKLPLTIKKQQENGLTSEKHGRQYITKRAGGRGRLISRNPVRGARVKKP